MSRTYLCLRVCFMLWHLRKSARIASESCKRDVPLFCRYRTSDLGLPFQTLPVVARQSMIDHHIGVQNTNLAQGVDRICRSVVSVVDRLCGVRCCTIRLCILIYDEILTTLFHCTCCTCDPAYCCFLWLSSSARSKVNVLTSTT